MKERGSIRLEELGKLTDNTADIQPLASGIDTC